MKEDKIKKRKKISFLPKLGKFLLLLAFCLSIFYAEASDNTKVNVKPVSRDSILVNKLFYLFTVLESDAKVKSIINKSKILNQIAAAQLNRTTQSLKDCKDGKCYAQAIRWKEDEIKTAGSELVRLLQSSKKSQLVIERIKKSGHFAIYHELSDIAFIQKVWESNANGINRIFHVYLGGNAPKRYAAIDSISYSQNDPVFVAKIDSALAISATKHNSPFYALSLKASLAILDVNGRDEAARYEPLTAGYNATAFKRVKDVNWAVYKYSALLVPGFGPEKAGVRLHERGIARCKMAAERFKKGLAPFIIVSGGHVYPFRTPFSEAVEMRRYLIEEFNIPQEAIIIEPHARHTTTNIRNASRLLYKFGIPDTKPGLVVTDAAQTKMIENLAARCIRELGYVPYKNVKVLNENEVEFMPSTKAFQINLEDILDP